MDDRPTLRQFDHMMNHLYMCERPRNPASCVYNSVMFRKPNKLNRERNCPPLQHSARKHEMT